MMTMRRVAPVSSKLFRALKGGWMALSFCGFSVNENTLLWTFQALFGYC